MEEGQKYYCSDEELGKQLHQLFEVEGESEVEIHHPTEGVIVYTRDTYKTQIEALAKLLAMSPAERLELKAKTKRKLQMSFRTQLIDAKCFTVDIDDEENFGKDIDGNEIDMNGTFVLVKDYPKGTRKLENELGAVMDESMTKAPIRILQKAN